MTTPTTPTAPPVAATTPPAPAAPPPAGAPLAFAWSELPGGNGSVIRPWLTEDDQQAVRPLFSTSLRFGRIEDDARGTGTTIRPRISAEHRDMVETTLRARWAKYGIDPRSRPRTQPTAASGPPRPAPRPTIPDPRIVFAPAAWLKYLFMANARGGHTEVGGYGVHELRGAHKEVVYVRDFVTVPQKVEPTFCALDPDATNELYVELCLADESFRKLAVWCHTHPGFSVTPSSVDWATFDDLVAPTADGQADWAAMVIIDRNGKVGAHLRRTTAFNTVTTEVPVVVDWAALPEAGGRLEAGAWAAWAAEFDRNIWPSAREFHPDHRGSAFRAGPSLFQKALVEIGGGDTAWFAGPGRFATTQDADEDAWRRALRRQSTGFTVGDAARDADDDDEQSELAAYYRSHFGVGGDPDDLADLADLTPDELDPDLEDAESDRLEQETDLRFRRRGRRRRGRDPRHNPVRPNR